MLILCVSFCEYTKTVAIAASNSVLREWRLWHKNAKEGILWWPDGSRQWGETHIRVCLYNWFNMAGTWLGCSDCLRGKSTAAWPHDVLWRFLGNTGFGGQTQKHRSVSNDNLRNVSKSLFFCHVHFLFHFLISTMDLTTITRPKISHVCCQDSGAPSPSTSTQRRSLKHCSIRFTVDSSAERMQARGS